MRFSSLGLIVALAACSTAPTESWLSPSAAREDLFPRPHLVLAAADSNPTVGQVVALTAEAIDIDSKKAPQTAIQWLGQDCSVSSTRLKGSRAEATGASIGNCYAIAFVSRTDGIIERDSILLHVTAP